MFMKRPRHRVFDYTPRFYNPNTDPVKRKKRKLGFRRGKHLAKQKNPIIWLIFVIVIIIKLFRLNHFF